MKRDFDGRWKDFYNGFLFKCKFLLNIRSYFVVEKLIIIFRYGVNFFFFICYLISFRCLLYLVIIF